MTWSLQCRRKRGCWYFYNKSGSAGKGLKLTAIESALMNKGICEPFVCVPTQVRAFGVLSMYGVCMMWVAVAYRTCAHTCMFTWYVMYLCGGLYVKGSLLYARYVGGCCLLNVCICTCICLWCVNYVWEVCESGSWLVCCVCDCGGCACTNAY